MGARRKLCFIAQQVGGKNDEDLSQRLVDVLSPRFPMHTLVNNTSALQEAGFMILTAQEAFTPIRFFDVGALVYFAKIIPWEFPGFSVEGSFAKLSQCQKAIEKKGFIGGTEYRFIIVAQKTSIRHGIA